MDQRDYPKKKLKRPLRSPDTRKETAPHALYDAKCSRCGKTMKIGFDPDPNRPVYCEACFMKLKQDIREGKISPSRIEGDASSPPRNTVSLVDLTTKKDINADPQDDLFDDVRYDR